MCSGPQRLCNIEIMIHTTREYQLVSVQRGISRDISGVIFAGNPHHSQYGDHYSHLLSHSLANPIPPRPIQVVLQLHRIFPRVEMRVSTLWDRHPKEFAQWAPTLVCSEL
ncbi:hypothetical protein H113_00657 [Trichophyton rubrum MR1459]|uniref:Uncharacterized protein n=1 Tax=Trichophyton rubrum (strain ATCC MYA-4607 / CBS 118892) TaxID=559305 RepID=A0A080WPM1_TRIRC|nr:uncharacterized protein TERG_12590 [Trichophyton rubrum CBS 118892]EZF99765.1 hypothetical protein H113_00657 [Trichophyton rubrum MR1459]EZG05723.1 hypothetical protein H106_04741 [Trichophyton rubrum CBS 735.88]KFL62827.1 hypothetical protein TERG_12590 [Trichophyton rubrum CBS 118892]